MRKRLTMILVALGLAGSVCLSWLALRAEEGGVLVVDRSEQDFGTVRPGALKHTFTLINASERPIELVRIIKGCSCDSVTLQAKSLQPRQSAPMNCEFDVTGRRGSYLTHIIVLYRELAPNHPQEHTIQCTVRAKIDPIVQVIPPGLAFQLGRSETKRLQVASSEARVQVTRASCDHPAFDVSVTETGQSIDVAFDSSRWRDPDGNVAIDVQTTCESERRIRVPVRIVRSLENSDS